MHTTTQPRTLPDPLLSPSFRANLLTIYRHLDACGREPGNPYLPAPAWVLTDEQRAEMMALEAA